MNGDEAVVEVTREEDVALIRAFGDAEARGDDIDKPPLRTLNVALAVGVTEGLFKLMVVAGA